ncbi:phosphatidate cytidylyltransferase [Sparganum proliferum]
MEDVDEAVRKRMARGDQPHPSRTSSSRSPRKKEPPFDPKNSKSADSSSNEEPTDTPFPSDLEPEAVRDLTQGTSHVPGFLEKSVEGLPPKLSNLILRTLMSIFMIGGFSFLVYLGPLALVVLVLFLQMGCFKEIIHIGHVVYRSHDLPWFRTLSWVFLFASNYFLFGESLIGRFRILLAKEDFLAPLVVHHRFISFCLYCACIMAFVLNLVRRHYLKQFTLFGWTHVTLLLIVTSSHLMIQSIFDGLIWFLIPTAMVISNDIMAYIFGMMLGKTPLIKLSPKKTWEGFIGGGISSMLLGILFSLAVIDNKHFICPIEYDDTLGALSMDCVPDPIFIPRTYNVSRWLFFVPFRTFSWYPYFKHCIVIGLFVSFVGPFGGFFASGFKRAFRIKDFGDVIPGHGGIMDRFDCQIITGWFVFIYYNSFVKPASTGSLLQQIFVLPHHEQLAFLATFVDGLTRRGVLPATLSQPILEFAEQARKSAAMASSPTDDLPDTP